MDNKTVLPSSPMEDSMEKGSMDKGNALETTASIDQAQLVELHNDRNGKFHRSFTPRQIHVSTNCHLLSDTNPSYRLSL